MLLALKVRPEAFPNGSPMSVLKKLCNVEVNKAIAPHEVDHIDFTTDKTAEQVNQGEGE